MGWKYVGVGRVEGERVRFVMLVNLVLTGLLIWWFSGGFYDQLKGRYCCFTAWDVVYFPAISLLTYSTSTRAQKCIQSHIPKQPLSPNAF